LIDGYNLTAHVEIKKFYLVFLPKYHKSWVSMHGLSSLLSSSGMQRHTNSGIDVGSAENGIGHVEVLGCHRHRPQCQSVEKTQKSFDLDLDCLTWGI